MAIFRVPTARRSIGGAEELINGRGRSRARRPADAGEAVRAGDHSQSHSTCIRGGSPNDCSTGPGLTARVQAGAHIGSTARKACSVPYRGPGPGVRRRPRIRAGCRSGPHAVSGPMTGPGRRRGREDIATSVARRGRGGGDYFNAVPSAVAGGPVGCRRGASGVPAMVTTPCSLTWASRRSARPRPSTTAKTTAPTGSRTDARADGAQAPAHGNQVAAGGNTLPHRQFGETQG